MITATSKIITGYYKRTRNWQWVKNKNVESAQLQISLNVYLDS